MTTTRDEQIKAQAGLTFSFQEDYAKLIMRYEAMGLKTPLIAWMSLSMLAQQAPDKEEFDSMCQKAWDGMIKEKERQLGKPHH
jgi:hypothetical protein